MVHVNYRGSTGYGSAWRDALTARIGHTELADVAAVHDHLVAAGLVDPARSVLAGYSWGGFLTLLGLGTQPSRWAAGIGGVPVADYTQAYESEMEPLQAYDRALFGGSPDDVPTAYQEPSPLTYVDQVSAPVVILAGENDPRCPIRQIDTYLDALAERGANYAHYRYEAGHGSMVVEERIRQVACEIAFARAALGLPPSSAPAPALINCYRACEVGRFGTCGTRVNPIISVFEVDRAGMHDGRDGLFWSTGIRSGRRPGASLERANV